MTDVKVAWDARGTMAGQPLTLPFGHEVLAVEPAGAPGWITIYHDRYSTHEDPQQRERAWRLHITGNAQPLPMRWDWRGLVLLDGEHVMVHMERKN